MPNYKYECGNCGHSFVEFQAITEPPLVECPSCHVYSLKRLIGQGTGIIFKGTGFYTTDYKKSTEKKDPKVSTETCKTCCNVDKKTTCGGSN